MKVEMQTGGYTLPVLWADFNMLGTVPDCDSQKCLPVRPDDWRLNEGEKVVLRDHDGNRCYGRIRHLRDNYVGVHAHLSTWQDGPA
jgi:hypothetical protein